MKDECTVLQVMTVRERQLNAQQQEQTIKATNDESTVLMTVVMTVRERQLYAQQQEQTLKGMNEEQIALQVLTVRKR